MVDQADAQGLLGGNHFPRQAQFVRDALATQTSEPLRAAVSGNDSEFHFRLAKLRVLAGLADRAGQRQFASTSQRETVDRRDGGFPQRFEAMENALAEGCR